VLDDTGGVVAVVVCCVTVLVSVAAPEPALPEPALV
jgi:hypothetical protein